ncbi:MAG: acetylxylan esterase, partial [Lentisphaeria bacterium]|nr:acetylxylan esterase [Lentisphaeria bacterium]
TDRPDAVYTCGETVTFTVSVKDKGVVVQTGEVSVSLSLDRGRSLGQQETALKNGSAVFTGTLDQPGFLRASVRVKHGGKTYRGLGSAGFEPEKIRPATTLPDDFESFWEAGRKRIAAIPADYRERRIEKKCTAAYDSFAISFGNIDGTRIYGFLCVPKGAGPFPAWVSVPGAGPGPSGPPTGYAAKGCLTMVISVHAYDVGSLSREEVAAAYKELNKSGIYSHHGAPDPEKYYFRRAILGVDRAIDWLASRRDWDRRHMVIDGSSQGGAFALIMTGLNKNITAAAANVPAMCDHAGAKLERAPGWPRIVRGDAEEQAARLKMSTYFDAVNFGRFIRVPVIMSAGFIDGTCSPSSVYAAHSVISSPKRIFNGPLAGHQWNVGDYRPFLAKWVPGQLGIAPVVPPTDVAKHTPEKK